MKTELPPSFKKIEQTERINFLNTIEEFVLEKFRENRDKDSILISIYDIKNAVAIEEINEDSIELIKNFFEQKGIKVIFPYIDGETGDEYFQFIMPTEEDI